MCINTAYKQLKSFRTQINMKFQKSEMMSKQTFAEPTYNESDYEVLLWEESEYDCNQSNSNSQVSLLKGAIYRWQDQQKHYHKSDDFIRNLEPTQRQTLA
jgi:hypothetical protein